MIDAHCHIDQYNAPERVAQAAERSGIQTIAVTNLPSHYLIAKEHLAGYQFVHPALGFHPLAAIKCADELPLFMQLAGGAEYIGEIGLDFSAAGSRTRERQLLNIQAILPMLKGGGRFITVHSRGAERHVLECLEKASVWPVCFHWFSGALSQLKLVIEAGHYISINPAMVIVKKWNEWVKDIPLAQVLSETDGPFVRCDGRPAEPKDVRIVEEWLGQRLGMPPDGVKERLRENYQRIMNQV